MAGPIFEPKPMLWLVGRLREPLHKRIKDVAGKKATVEQLAHHAQLVAWRELLNTLEREALAEGAAFVQLDDKQTAALAALQEAEASWR